MMKLKKNIQVGKISYLIILFYFMFVNVISSINALETKENLGGKFIDSDFNVSWLDNEKII